MDPATLPELGRWGLGDRWRAPGSWTAWVRWGGGVAGGDPRGPVGPMGPMGRMGPMEPMGPMGHIPCTRRLQNRAQRPPIFKLPVPFSGGPRGRRLPFESCAHGMKASRRHTRTAKLGTVLNLPGGRFVLCLQNPSTRRRQIGNRRRSAHQFSNLWCSAPRMYAPMESNTRMECLRDFILWGEFASFWNRC